MRIRTKLAAILAALMLVGGVLAACAPSVNVENFVGDWEFMYGSQEELSQETVDFAKSIGSNAVMTLQEDGTGSFDLYGDVQNLTWSAKSDTEGSVTLEDTEAASMTVDGDQLVLSDAAENTLTFQRLVQEDESASDSES